MFCSVGTLKENDRVLLVRVVVDLQHQVRQTEGTQPLLIMATHPIMPTDTTMRIINTILNVHQASIAK
jgi:hypothetical protein